MKLLEIRFSFFYNAAGQVDLGDDYEDAGTLDMCGLLLRKKMIDLTSVCFKADLWRVLVYLSRSKHLRVPSMEWRTSFRAHLFDIFRQLSQTFPHCSAGSC